MCNHAIDNVCLYIALEMFCQLEKQMEVRQYYEALKTLEQLEHTLLPQISG